MNREIQTMLDAKATVGTLMTSASAGWAWLDIAEPIVTMTVTLVVGGVTLWYTVERALKLRKERKNDRSKKDQGPSSNTGDDGGSMGDCHR